MSSTLDKPYVPRLTRSCNACVKSKRKCSLDQPVCQRCQVRGVHCKYVNEPLNGSTQKRERPCQLPASSNAVIWLGPEASPADVSPIGQELDLVDKPDLHGRRRSCSPVRFRISDPQCHIYVDLETVNFITSLTRGHVYSFGFAGHNTFIHRNLARHREIRRLKHLCKESLIRLSLHSDATLDIASDIELFAGRLCDRMDAAVAVQDILACVQSLILLQVLSLFVVRLTGRQKLRAEVRQHQLTLWTRKLWQAAPAQLPSSLSQHEAFLIAESIRRTIIVSSDFRALCHCIQHGWIFHNLFLDSLPFERRATLWDAPRQEFEEAFLLTGDGKQDIISWREFVDTIDVDMVTTLTSFEMMLLVGAKSKPGVEEWLGKPLEATE